MGEQIEKDLKKLLRTKEAFLSSVKEARDEEEKKLQIKKIDNIAFSKLFNSKVGDINIGKELADLKKQKISLRQEIKKGKKTKKLQIKEIKKEIENIKLSLSLIGMFLTKASPEIPGLRTPEEEEFQKLLSKYLSPIHVYIDPKKPESGKVKAFTKSMIINALDKFQIGSTASQAYAMIDKHFPDATDTEYI